MNKIKSAIQDLVKFLDDIKIPYYIIGGYAAAVYGNPRFTQDIDITIIIQESEIPGFINKIPNTFRFRVEKILEFVNNTCVIPIIHEDTQIPVDIILGLTSYEFEALGRSQTKKINSLEFKICSIEDLIIHKTLASRNRDIDDICYLAKNYEIIDWDYIRRTLCDMEQALDRADLLTVIEKVIL